MVKRFLKNGYLALVLLFLYAPIFVLIIYSFNESRTMGNWTGFSLKWYEALFRDPSIMDALGVTVTVGLLSATLATVIGTLAAVGIHSMRKGPRGIILNISNLPVVNPDIVTGISLMLVFTFLKMPLGYATLLVSHITFNIPYVVFSVLPKLQQTSDQFYEAALDLGASPSYALWRVVLPQVTPGIVTGWLLAFTLSLDDFVVSLFTTQGVSNLSITIYSMARRGINPKINALSALMFVVVLALLIVVTLRTQKDEKEHHRRKQANGNHSPGARAPKKRRHFGLSEH